MSVYIPLMVVLLGLGLSQQVTIHNPPRVQLFQDEGSAQHHLSQELVRTKRQSGQELVRAQPHLVHEMSRPEFRETSRSRAEMDSNSSHLNPPPSVSRGEAGPHAAVDENLNVEDEMERMVHLVDPREVDRFRGYTDPTEQEKELFSGPGAADTSMEASGLYGRDMESRTRGEEGQEDMRKDRRSQNGGNRGGEEEGGTFDTLERDHTSPDLDTLIGYSPSLLITRSQTPTEPPPAENPQEHQASPVLEAAGVEREQWEAEDEEEDNSSGYGVHRSAIAPRRTSSTAPGGTASPETETGTDFGMVGSFSKADEEEEEAADSEDREEDTGLALEDAFTQNPSVAMAPSRDVLQPGLEEEEESEQEEDEFRGQTGVSVNYSSEEAEDKWREMDEERRIRHIIPHTTDPSTNFSWDWLAKTETLQARRSEVRGGGTPEVLLPDRNVDEMETQQVMCLDWSELAGKGYVILNMTQNFNCEEFRVDQGVRLLKIMEQLFASRMNSPEGSWVLYLSKPTHQQHQLLMNVVSENGVIATDDVLDMLGKIRTSLKKVGIQDYGAASSCQTRAGQTRSDYGKLFVVLVIIGSVCMVIITSGFIYICWQRRLPASKTTAGFRADELHFVENGCHDNPMLDMANGGQSELQEKKPSTNGLSGGEGGREQSTSWQVFVNQAATEAEEEEQDTHL